MKKQEINILEKDFFLTDDESLEKEFVDIQKEIIEQDLIIPQNIDAELRLHFKQYYQRKRFKILGLKLGSIAAVLAFSTYCILGLEIFSSNNKEALRQDVAYLEQIYEMEEEWLSNYEMPELDSLEELIISE